VACVSKVEHCPPVGVRVRLGDLIQGRVVRVDNLVDGAPDAVVLNCPTQLTGRLAPDDIRLPAAAAMTRVGRTGYTAIRRKELGDAEVTLR
jgi:hypothetical protein